MDIVFKVFSSNEQFFGYVLLIYFSSLKQFIIFSIFFKIVIYYYKHLINKNKFWLLINFFFFKTIYYNYKIM